MPIGELYGNTREKNGRNAGGERGEKSGRKVGEKSRGEKPGRKAGEKTQGENTGRKHREKNGMTRREKQRCVTSQWYRVDDKSMV